MSALRNSMNTESELLSAGGNLVTLFRFFWWQICIWSSLIRPSKLPSPPIFIILLLLFTCCPLACATNLVDNNYKPPFFLLILHLWAAFTVTRNILASSADRRVECVSSCSATQLLAFCDEFGAPFPAI
jgi:hypothetical protein